MKFHYLIFFALLINLSCKHTNEKVQIQGDFPMVQNAVVKLSSLEDYNNVLSVVNVIDGKFSIELKNLDPDFYFLEISWPNLNPDTTIAPSGKIFTSGTSLLTKALYINPKEADFYKVLLTTPQPPTSIKLMKSEDFSKEMRLKVDSKSSNSKLYDFYQGELEAYQIVNKNLFDSLSTLRDNALEGKNMTLYNSTSDRMTNLWKGEVLPKMLSEMRKVYKQNTSSIIVPYLISRTVDLQEHFGEYSEIIKSLTGDAANSNYTKSAIERLSSLKNVGMNQVLPKPIGSDPVGKKYNFDPSKNKFTLIEFWASWCSPCRTSNPSLIKIYNKYAKSGFNILGVSIDTDASNWKLAIKEDSLPWQNISDLKDMSNSDNTSRFNVVEIPQNFLIDGEGKIVGINLYDEALENKLSDLFPTN